MTGGADGRPYDQTSELANERPVAAFSGPPAVDDVLFIGLSRAVPNCAVAIHVDCDAEGHGIDPTDPPWVWEALGDDGWVRCDVEDRTGGFNEPGDVIVHVPGSHVETVIEERTAGWLRCRIVAGDRRDADRLHRLPAAARHRGRHGRRHRQRRARRGHRRRGRRRVGGRAGPALRAAAPARRGVGTARAGRGGDGRRLGAVGAGPDVRRQQCRRRALAAQRQRRLDRVRPGRADGGRLAAQLRVDPAGRRARAGPPLPHGRGPGRQRRRPRDRHAALGDPVHRIRRQPAPGRRRGRRRVGRGGQDTRPARARHAQPGRHHPRLRAAGARGDTRGRARALPPRRRDRAASAPMRGTPPACACSSCRRSPRATACG